MNQPTRLFARKLTGPEPRCWIRGRIRYSAAAMAITATAVQTHRGVDPRFMAKAPNLLDFATIPAGPRWTVRCCPTVR